jgi:hypothetical protein
VRAKALMSKISATLINYIINIIFKLMGGKESTGLKVNNQLALHQIGASMVHVIQQLLQELRD